MSAWALLGVTAGLLLSAPAARAGTAAAPCIRPSRAATQVQGEVRICPGHYRIADPTERGVIIAASSGTSIDLTGVTLESGDSVPERYAGIGIASKGVDGITVVGGVVRGYRFGVRVEGGHGHRIIGGDLSGSRAQPLRSSAQRADSTDRLDPARVEAIERYGGAILLRNTVGATVTGVTARDSQNGIGLVEARDSYLADNTLTGNSGWAIHLWSSSHNLIVRNEATRTRRCPTPSLACAAAAVLLREASDSNTITDNDLTASSTGVLVTGQPPLAHASIGNLIIRNDASLAQESGFAALFTWSVTFLENRADSAAAGFRLIRVSASTLRGNTVIGARESGITVAHGSDNTIESNVLLGARVGIRVVAPERGAPASRGYRIDDNVLGGLEQGIVLEATTGSRVRGNLFDGVGSGLVIDSAGHGTEVTGNVFLRAAGWFIDAPDLVAGGNYWATTDANAAALRVHGRVSVLPWKPASAAGY
ncbi:MAG TPA: NosD domain-containing protein [Gemmatimonadales bacterium]|nr:NosD domain-containing protein [Gemmatimonadales bacterium]